MSDVSGTGMMHRHHIDRPIRAVQLSFFADPQGRDAETLLGIWPTLTGVAAGVAQAGVELTIVYAATRRQTLQRDSVTFHFIDDTRARPVRLPGGFRVPRRPRRLLEAVASLAPDVVHVHGLQYPVAIWQLVRSLPGIPVMIQDHKCRPPEGWRRRLWRTACRQVAGVAFTAREQAAPFVSAGVFRPELPVFEVLEGSSSFSPGDRDEARREAGIHGSPCFLWAAHLDANKDPLTVLTAFRDAAPRLPDARLWCCFGTAPLLAQVRRRIEQDLVLRARVTLLGQRPYSAMESLFRAADFLVQASHLEGSGYSVIEALSCGTTPLVTDIPPFRRILDDGRAGSLTPLGDARAMGEAMVAWARRDLAALRRTARARFEDALTYEVIGRQLRSAYQSLVASQ
jgi:glycosyltransferase involved in cell wall biosynthesis